MYPFIILSDPQNCFSFKSALFNNRFSWLSNARPQFLGVKITEAYIQLMLILVHEVHICNFYVTFWEFCCDSVLHLLKSLFLVLVDGFSYKVVWVCLEFYATGLSECGKTLMFISPFLNHLNHHCTIQSLTASSPATSHIF